MLQATYYSRFVAMPHLVLHEHLSSLNIVSVLLELGACKLEIASKLAITWDEFI
jgi:hypothetical protein